MSTAAFDTRTLAHPNGYRILVCVDGSTLSEECLPYGVSLARTFRGAVTLVRVMQPRSDASLPQLTDALGWELSRQEALAYLERIQAQVASELGRPAEVRLEQGRAAERIVDLAREIGASVTVLGRHGEGGLSPWKLGSTAQQVLAVTTSSVFVVGGAPAVAPASPKRVLVPLDGSLRTESALPTAARIARAHDAELLLVHIVREPLPSSVLRAGDDLDIARELAGRIEAGAHRYLDRLRTRLEREVRSVRTLVERHPSESQQLLDIARREEADLIVLSAHGSAAHAMRPFGSTTVDLLRGAPVPVMVLQDLSEHEFEPAGESMETVAPALRSSFPPEGR
jgi:nucleotide-binding universal stress UspA family protein